MPRIAYLRNRWIDNILPFIKSLTENTRVCNAHFRDDDFLEGQLITNSVPTVFNVSISNQSVDTSETFELIVDSCETSQLVPSTKDLQPRIKRLRTKRLMRVETITNLSVAKQIIEDQNKMIGKLPKGKKKLEK